MFKSIYEFYKDGFLNMRLGKQLWLLIAIKLFILFAVIKYFFFPNILEEKFNNDTERSDYVLQQLVTQGENNASH
jgi:hypothetical protein